MARSEGKYDAVLPKLKKFPVEDASYQDKIDRAKASIPNRNAPYVLVDQYVALRRAKDALEDQMYQLNIQIAAHEQLFEASQEAKAPEWGRYGVKDNALRLPDGGLLRVQAEPYPRVENQEIFRLWCHEEGYERQLHMHPSRMASLVKERLLDGKPEPDGCVTYVKTKVVFTPAKNGSE